MKIHLTRRYRFAASHRLHREQLGEEENCRIYGKCNNPFGHGHNYTFEVAVSGPVDKATGMIANPAELDAYVEREVIAPFEFKYLNEDVDVFRAVVPTAENICMEIYRRLQAFPKAHLERIRLEETSKNSFEYAGEPKPIGRR